jgi:hypothetical protein
MGLVTIDISRERHQSEWICLTRNGEKLTNADCKRLGIKQIPCLSGYISLITPDDAKYDAIAIDKKD